MEAQLERALPIVAGWGAWTLAALLAATLLAMWRLGRGRTLLVPDRRPSRIGQLGLLACAALLEGRCRRSTGSSATMPTAAWWW